MSKVSFSSIPISILSEVDRRLRSEGRFEFDEFAHEAEVWGDDAPFGPDEVEGVVQSHPRLEQQVGQDDGGGPRDSGLAVDENTLITMRGNKFHSFREENFDGFSGRVLDVDAVEGTTVGTIGCVGGPTTDTHSLNVAMSQEGGIQRGLYS